MTRRNSSTPHRIWRYPLVTLAVISAITAMVLALMGPFGSYLAMNLPSRLLYWAGVVAGAAYLVHFLRLGLMKLAVIRDSQLRLDLVTIVLFVALYVPPLYATTNWLTLGNAPFTMVQTAGLVLLTTAILISIREVSGLHAPGLALRQETTPQTEAEPVPSEGHDCEQQPPIAARLPVTARGSVLAISGSDHYVDVTTDAGSASVLLRFSDALREVEPVPGQRVHRSHWVADAAVARMRRDGKRHFVVLKSGDEVPVSRTYAQHAFDRWGAAAE